MKQSIKNFMKYTIIKFSKYTKITNLFYKLNKNRKIIIGYHNVIPDIYFDSSTNLDFSMKESSFKKQLEIINKKFDVGLDIYNTNEITLSFDDGYLNQYSIASKILDSYKMKGYFFYCANLIDEQDILLIDKIQYWIDYADKKIYNSEKYSIQLNLLNLKERRKSLDKITRLIDEKIDMQDICDELNKIFEFNNINLDKEFYNLRFTPIEIHNLETMKKMGHKIGAHSASHNILSNLSNDQLDNDISKCKEVLNNGVYNTKTFCYPFGSKKEVSDKVIEKVKSKGFDNALSFVNDVSKTDYNKYFIPRMTLPDTDDEDYIEFILSGVYYFIRNARLFPKMKVKGMI